ncbi:MAG: putative ABC-type transport system involved in lysophospholipase biosynthesis, permease component [Frankiales bacterium]|nr:putative ABC-type transport system involved in lysophospholipase biosynthesis, permease component [Frankiales bacterium]
MRTLRWTLGLLRRGPLVLLGIALSLAVTVGFVGALSAFVTHSRADLTVRAAAQVPVDWQVQLTAGADPDAVAAAVASLPDLRARARVDIATVPALSSTSVAGTRTTGAARVLSLPPGYAGQFPGEIRPLVGATTGVLLAQQTAANLAVAPGDSFTVARPDGTRSRLRVDGVVELPAADALFQVVGAPATAGATAPPDNVVLVPADRFPTVVGGAPVVRQVHLGFDHSRLPADPGAAAALVARRNNNLQVAVAGGALVGDNLHAALAGAREDALYSLLLVLLLGAPAVLLAAVVSGLVVALRGDRRRREVALLRLRGAPSGAVLRLATGETVVTLLLAVALGLPLAEMSARWALPGAAGLDRVAVALAVSAGLVIAAVTQLGPVLRTTLRRAGTGGAAGSVRTDTAAATVATRHPWPLRVGLDLVLLAAAGLTFWLTSRGGYQVVLASEGVAKTSVNYAALLGPALAWPGLTLLTWRAVAAVLNRRTGALSREASHSAPELRAASLRRRRHVVARGATGLAVALALAGSTAVFTATYNSQASLDVALTVGSDVAVTAPVSVALPAGTEQALSAAPGARAVEAVQHRFAYVGPDLQDVYGINPATIGRAAPLLDSFTPGSTIRAALGALAARPDGVLLSAETLHDYQLHPGDLVRLRLQTGQDRQYRPVDFHVVGLVTEFPTAPKDSFVVANASYLTARTGSAAVSTYLVSSADPTRTAGALRARLLGTGAQVNDVVSARSTVTTVSGLAAADLAGLSRLALAYGLALAVACSGLALLLGAAQRRRALVLLGALGATSRQRGSFLASEAWALLVGGVLAGGVIASVVSYLLVKVLTGIFDPPPTGPALPTAYLVGLVLSVVVSTLAAVPLISRLAARAGPAELRAL